VKPEAPCRETLRRVKGPLTCLRYWYAKFLLLRPFLLLAMSLLVGLPESSGGRVRSFPQSASSPWLFHAHMSPEVWTIASLVAAVLRCKSHPIDMIKEHTVTLCFILISFVWFSL
jgi:hypothetical protein